MADEITFQNDPVDPSVEFRKQHNHFFVAQKAERLDPDRPEGEVLWKRMSLAQRVSYHQVTLQLEDYAVWRDMPEHEYADERLRYSLLPYVVEQAEAACERGHPLLRPLFFEFPGDPGSWLVEDQYMLGTDLLVAPLFEDASERRVYLPPGRWHRFAEDEGTALDGPGWHTLAVEEVPAAVLVRDRATVRMTAPAQHTGELDWDGAREWRPAG